MLPHFPPNWNTKALYTGFKDTKYNALRLIQDTYHNASWCQSGDEDEEGKLENASSFLEFFGVK